MKSLMPLLVMQGASCALLDEAASTGDAAIHRDSNGTNRKRRWIDSSTSHVAFSSFRLDDTDVDNAAITNLRGSSPLSRALNDEPNMNNGEDATLSSSLLSSSSSSSAQDYLAAHPFFPSHSTQTCLDSRSTPPPEWMTLQGGYAETHLFATMDECCAKWGFEQCVDGAVVGAGRTMDDAAAVSARPLHDKNAQELPKEEEDPVVAQMDATLDGTLDDSNENPMSESAALSSFSSSVDTFPTYSCGTSFATASQCTQLCLSGSPCPDGQSCFSDIPCPSSLVAAAMGSVGDEILDLVDGGRNNDLITRNVCGSTYDEAEATCKHGYTESFTACNDGATCPEGQICYTSILCPMPPTVSPMPTRAPFPDYSMEDHPFSVVGYYAAWQWYDRQKVAVPQNIPWNRITRVAYAFFMLDESGDIWGTDSWADPRILYGDIVVTPPVGEVCSPLNSTATGCFCHWSEKNVKECAFHDTSTGLIHLAHANGVEVYPSIGGWTLSDPFPAMAAGPSARDHFAQKCVELIQEYQFDGIDIDWEYPGYADHSGTPDDTQNFVLLLRAIREALDDLGSRTDKYYGLTAALPCGPSNIANADVVAVSEILDELNLMTYDFHGAWDASTGVNAPLFDQAKGDPEKGWSVHGCVENWVGSTSGNPKGEEMRKKVNIGLPFYGRSYLDAKELYAPHGGVDEINWNEDDGSPQYFNLMARMNEMTSVRDDVTKTQYAYFNNGGGFVSYDDERAICDKADYVISNRLGGAIIWEMSGDMMDDLYSPLLEALNRKLVKQDLDCEETFGGRQEALSGGFTSESNLSPVANIAVLTPEAKEVLTEDPIIRKDKSEIVGIPSVERPVPDQAPAPQPHSTPSINESPYTIDKSTLGTISVAAASCTGGCPSGSTCVGNQAGGQLIKDEECAPCNSGQTWWPCDIQGLCWCWLDGTDRIAPAPESGVEIQVSDPHYTVCDDILTREIFDIIAPEHKEPYSYTGLCDAILSYNAHHSEKAFGMGDLFERAAELAAFLGNTLHESDEFRAGREYLMCADHMTIGDQVYCKPCDSGSFDWSTFTCPQSLISGEAEFNEYCQPSSVPPEACNCGNGKSQTGELEGYVPAKDLFFGRGAIQLSWNYNYIGASIALTGSPDTFCKNPDLVATEGKYAWGAGLFFWMEHSKEGTTCHTESLKNMDFGGTLNNINGGLECPAHGGWHEEAVKSRLNRYCRASKALGLPNLMTLSRCAGLEEKMAACLSDGTCTDCQDFVGSTPGDHPTSFVLPAPVLSATASNASAEEHAEPQTEAPLCNNGLMALPGHPECCVSNIAFIGDGACDPDAPYNTEACGWDGGDCCRQTCNQDSPFGCKTKEGGDLEEYGPFGFFCLDPSQGVSRVTKLMTILLTVHVMPQIVSLSFQDDVIDSTRCIDVERERIGDGKCNPLYNTAECNFDGGDCCEETCDDNFAFYPCGSGVQSYVCMDPRFKVDTTTPSSRPTPATIQASKVPTNLSTQRPTQKTRKPTLSPSSGPISGPLSTILHDPVQNTIESFSSDSFASSAQSIESNSPPCPSDYKECKGTGIFVERDPENNCRFRPCEHSMLSDNTSPSANINQSKMPCPSDFKECKNSGIFVSRNPLNGCKFNTCPEKKDELEHKDAPLDAASYFAETTAFQDVPQSPNIQCPSDFKECSGTGIFVSRDSSNNCRFKPCPSSKDERPSDLDHTDEHSFSSMIESAMHGINSSAAGVDILGTMTPTPVPSKSVEVSLCPQDLRECLGGNFVGRDPANGCRYFPCAHPHADDDEQNGGNSKHTIAKSVSEALGGLHHKDSALDEVEIMRSDLLNSVSKTNPDAVDSYSATMASLTRSSSSHNKSVQHSEIMLKPTDDASIYGGHKTRSFGFEEDLKVDADSGKIHSLIRFDLYSKIPLTANNIQHATLRLWATDSTSTSGGSVESAEHSDWSESTVTWSAAPRGSHDFSDTLGKITAGSWCSLNVTPLLKDAVNNGNKSITFRLSTLDHDRGGYASKEFMNGEYSPALVVDVLESVTLGLPQEKMNNHRKGNA
eukprot:CCRYP_015903-RA/>CCRYP_015903-RA protein AED:0.05 eAED:0.05 QI:474/1/1/1/1/0.9/10/478/2037